VDGPNNIAIPAITRIITGDGARHTFVYNAWGQVEDIWTYGEADNQRAAMDYAFPGTSSPQSDCPRFTQRNDYIANWAGATGNGWVSSYFYFDPNETYGQVTGPDGVTHKEIFSASGNTRGLTTRTETHYGGAIQQFTDIVWLSDSIASPPLRPRVTETKTCDDRNHNGTYESGTDKLRKTTIDYLTLGTTIRLPEIVKNYNEGGGSVYRSTRMDYVPGSSYLNRRIIGLPRFTYLYEGDQTTLKAQVEYVYDTALGPGVYALGHSPAPRQHDGTYGTGFQFRGNLAKVRRYSVTNGVASSSTETTTGYYITSTAAFTKDALNHQTDILYEDNFLHYTETSPGVLNSTSVEPDPPTYAYPTKVTVDETPNDVSSTASYNYYFGAVTRSVNPKAYAANPQDPQTMQVNTYDPKGRLDKALVWKNGAKYSQIRYVYGTDHNWVQTWATANTLSEEAAVLHMLDGVGRERIVMNEHPGSQGGLSAYYRVFDKMGRVVERSRPTEISSQTWLPTGDDTAYVYSLQAYDWKGRPTITTNPDTTTARIDYTGCGCAGADVAELTDETGRKRKVYRDVFGRQEKTESLNSNGSVCSTQTNAFNVRDQITQVNQIAGTNGTS